MSTFMLYIFIFSMIPIFCLFAFHQAPSILQPFILIFFLHVCIWMHCYHGKEKRREAQDGETSSLRKNRKGCIFSEYISTFQKGNVWANGEGSVYQRKQGQWVAAISLATGTNTPPFQSTSSAREADLHCCVPLSQGNVLNTLSHGERI